MFDIGWTEMTVIVILAIIVIGPKDLPKVLRTLGHWLRKARGMAREFQSGLDQIMREAELDDLKSQVESVAHLDPVREIEKAVDPDGEIARALGRTEPGSEAGAKPAPEPKRPAGEPEPGSGPEAAAKPDPERKDHPDEPEQGAGPAAAGKPRPGE